MRVGEDGQESDEGIKRGQRLMGKMVAMPLLACRERERGKYEHEVREIRICNPTFNTLPYQILGITHVIFFFMSFHVNFKS